MKQQRCAKKGRWHKLVAMVVGTVCLVDIASAAPSVKIDHVAQRWPWNNKVDITYTVTEGQCRETEDYCGVEFQIAVPGVTNILLHGYSIGASADGGVDGTQHTITWNAPTGIKATDCTVTATLFSTNVPSGNDYMIVDILSGNVYYEGLCSTQDISNERYTNNVMYRTSHFVLRRVPKWTDKDALPNGESIIGGYPTGWDDPSGKLNFYNSPNRWTPDRDYYISIFITTEDQWRLVHGYDALGRKWPSTNVTWDGLRVSGTKPGDSIPLESKPNTGTFFQRLNYRTGNKYAFDIPTEVMFEIAQRAGSTTMYAWGDEWDDRYVMYRDHGNKKEVDVGSFLPNSWGLFDMTGHVTEWCRDGAVTATTDMASKQDVFTPSYLEGNLNRYRRGAGVWSSWAKDPGFCASHRSVVACNSGAWNNIGFRIAFIAEK
jgi:hypothetical protein